MTSEFQRKLQETKDKAQEGLSEFQKKMQEKHEIEFARTKVSNHRGNGNKTIRNRAFYIDLAAERPYYEYANQRIVSR